MCHYKMYRRTLRRRSWKRHANSKSKKSASSNISWHTCKICTFEFAKVINEQSRTRLIQFDKSCHGLNIEEKKTNEELIRFIG